MEFTQFAAKIFDDNKRISFFSERLLDLVKKEYRTRKINAGDYERFVTLLTCLNLQTEESRKEIEKYIVIESEKMIRIDMKV